MPRGVEGLLVACRGLSMTVDAHYSFRMMPELQQIGEAAGIAAALAVKGGVTPRALDARLVQEELTRRNVLGESRRPPALIPDRPAEDLEQMLLSDKPQDAVWLLLHAEGRAGGHDALSDHGLPNSRHRRTIMAQRRFWVRKLDEVEEERSTCGFRKRILKRDDFEGLSISLLNLHAAKPHHHDKLTEFYYVVDGRGALEIDGEQVEVEEGTLVKIEPGASHRAVGDFTALVLCVPAYTEEDMFLD